MPIKVPALIAATAVLLVPATARAEPAVGVLAGSNVLAGFDTATPGTLTGLKPITGLTAAGERVLGLDYRHLPLAFGDVPPPPGLYALGVAGGNQLRLYRLDAGTGAATLVSGAAAAAAAPGARFGFDFNPASDRARVVNENDANLRLNPNNGALSGADTPVNPPSAQVTGVAYDRVHVPPTLPATPGATTLYAIHTGGQLGTIGGIGGDPSPNLGEFNVIGPLGVAPDPSMGTDLDIAFGGAAYATLTSGGAQGLYAINLGAGDATLIGATAAPLAGFATIPGSTVAFAAPAQVVGEAAGGATLTVSRDGALSATTTVAWSASTGAAGTITFGPGEASTTLSVPAPADTVDEPDETITITLSAPSFPATLGAPAAATLTIADDDAPPATPDRAAPALALAGLPKTVTYKRLLRRGVAVTATPSEAAVLEAALQGTTRRARLSAFELTLAARTLPLAAGARTLTLKPRRRALRRPARAVRLRVRLVATDAAGNRRVARRTLRLRR